MPTSFEAWYNAVVYHEDTPVVETAEERLYRYRSDGIRTKVGYGLGWQCLPHPLSRWRHQDEQGGHNQDKRKHRHQVNLAVLATVADHIPLVHAPYAGDVPDPTVFGQALDRLDHGYRQLAVLTGGPITMVFDNGNVRQAHRAAGWARASVASTRVPSHQKGLWPCHRPPTRRWGPPRWPDLRSRRGDLQSGPLGRPDAGRSRPTAND